MLVSDFNYDLPEERIAKYPPDQRGASRLLVLDRATGKYKDDYYKNLDQFLNSGDLLILNDTRVMHARIYCELTTNHPRELVVLERHDGELHKVMFRGKIRPGDVLHVITAGLNTRIRNIEQLNYAARYADKITLRTYDKITVEHVYDDGTADVTATRPLDDIAEDYGTVPLPPYLHRNAKKLDRTRYQTIWAKHTGSAAAPTASLNMTEDLLKRLEKKGVIIKYLTLHVGLGTFLPIRTDNVEDHKMHSEWFHIPDNTVEAITKIKNTKNTTPAKTGAQPAGTLSQQNNSSAKSKTKLSGSLPQRSTSPQGPKVVALGTTVARTLEYYAKTGKTSGEDDIFIYPGYEFQLVDALITNFHAPRSTVLMLASAFAGWDHLRAAYEHCIAEGYNFLSYGDSMLIC